MSSRTLSNWDIRSIYELPADDLMESEAFFSAFGKYSDVNGHHLEVIRTRPKSAVMTSLPEQDSLNLADTVLVMRTADVSGITAGESLRLDGKLYRILSVSYPLKSVVRLDLQGVEA